MDAGGLDRFEMATRIAESREALNRRSDDPFPDCETGTFIRMAYLLGDDRLPDAFEIEVQRQRLAGGTTRRALVEEMTRTAFARIAADVLDIPPASHDPGVVNVMGTARQMTLEEWTALRREPVVQAEAAPADPARVDPGAVGGFAPLRPDVTISVITSLYRGGAYIADFLAGMTAQTVFRDHVELVIVDAASPEDEAGAIRAARADHPNIVYHRLPERTSVYEAWNIAIAMSRGTFVTNANLDDLRRADSLEIQARTLQALPFVDIVYQDFLYAMEHGPGFDEIARIDIRSDLPIVSPLNILSLNAPHNAPMSGGAPCTTNWAVSTRRSSRRATAISGRAACWRASGSTRATCRMWRISRTPRACPRGRRPRARGIRGRSGNATPAIWPILRRPAPMPTSPPCSGRSDRTGPPRGPGPGGRWSDTPCGAWRRHGGPPPQTPANDRTFCPDTRADRRRRDGRPAGCGPCGAMLPGDAVAPRGPPGLDTLILDRGGLSGIADLPARMRIPFPMSRKLWSGPADSALLQEICDHYEIDVVVGTLTATPLRTPLVQIALDAGSHPPGPWAAERDLALGFASGILCLSDRIREDIAAAWPLRPAETCVVVPPGVRTDALAAATNAQIAAFRQRHRVVRNYVLCVDFHRTGRPRRHPGADARRADARQSRRLRSDLHRHGRRAHRPDRGRPPDPGRRARRRHLRRRLHRCPGPVVSPRAAGFGDRRAGGDGIGLSVRWSSPGPSARWLGMPPRPSTRATPRVWPGRWPGSVRTRRCARLR